MTTHHLDNRGLPPPEPMVRILKALMDLERDDDLRVLMDREPLMLFPELERRGWRWAFEWEGAIGILQISRDTES